MKWNTNHINCGEVPENSTVEGVFKTEHYDKIKEITIGCPGCTKYYWNKENTELTMVVKLNNIPRHLQEQGVQPFRKFLKIHYLSGAVELLLLTGKKIKS